MGVLLCQKGSPRNIIHLEVKLLRKSESGLKLFTTKGQRPLFVLAGDTASLVYLCKSDHWVVVASYGCATVKGGSSIKDGMCQTARDNTCPPCTVIQMKSE